MNNEEKQSKEFRLRMESKQWSQNIANNVSRKYERRQNRNRIIISFSSILILISFFTLSFFIPLELPNSSTTELENYRIFLTDDFPLYEAIYQEASFTSLIEPISFLTK